MTRYSPETALDLAGFVTPNHALLHRQKQLLSSSDGFMRSQVYFNCFDASAT